MGTMRQRNLNAQCERNRMRQGWGGVAGTPLFGFIFMRRVLSLVLLDFCSAFSRRFLSVFCALIAFVSIRLVRTKTNCRKYANAWCSLSDIVWELGSAMATDCNSVLWKGAGVCGGRGVWAPLGTHLPCKRRLARWNKSKRRQRITLRDTCTELNCHLQWVYPTKPPPSFSLFHPSLSSAPAQRNWITFSLDFMLKSRQKGKSQTAVEIKIN